MFSISIHQYSREKEKRSPVLPGPRDPTNLGSKRDAPCSSARDTLTRNVAAVEKAHLLFAVRARQQAMEDPEKLAEELKNEGNAFFKNKEYRDALSKYEEALSAYLWLSL